MSQTPRKQNFLQGTALLAMATVVVKLIGALKDPLKCHHRPGGLQLFQHRL